VSDRPQKPRPTPNDPTRILVPDEPTRVLNEHGYPSGTKPPSEIVAPNVALRPHPDSTPKQNPNSAAVSPATSQGG
jgi:hypothetical protein